MTRRFAGIALFALLLSAPAMRADEPKETKPSVEKKYHVYTFGCRRLGTRLAVATDDPQEVRRVVDAAQAIGQQVQVVTGTHDRNEVGATKPVRYEVFGDGPRRCGTMRSLAVSTTAPDYAAIGKEGWLHPCFTVVSFR